jgi:hypothetical protein
MDICGYRINPILIRVSRVVDYIWFLSFAMVFGSFIFLLILASKLRSI